MVRLNRARLCVALLAWPLLAAAPADRQEHFASPEAATEALAAAARLHDAARLERLFGKAGLEVVSAGDPVANEQERARFVAAYDTRHVVDTQDGTAILAIGDAGWPFPIPLKRAAAGWSFDVAAGREEILDRRIGANELYVQQVVLAYVDAQREYAESGHDGAAASAYAQRVLSTPGRHDGLYWPTADGDAPSPLGALIAEAQASGYRPGQGDGPRPFHGYYFRILTAQGRHARGGAYDYIAHGRMIGGFALVAWPARWGSTGVMTFTVNQDGEIFQKDLGPQTATLAGAMTAFDPGPTWRKIGAPEPLAGLPDEPAGTAAPFR